MTRPADDQEAAPWRGATAPQRVVVVGFGMAGGRFVDELLTREVNGRATRRSAVTVVGAEPYPAYNRVLLSDVVAGRADVTALGLRDPGHHASRGIDIRVSSHATGLDLQVGAVTLDDGSRLPFDRLLLATGAEPVVPALDGLDPDRSRPAGVYTLRTIDDAREIVAATTNASRAVVLGGGPLGLEAARGLAHRGLAVQLLHAGDHLLAGVLDPTGGIVLSRALRRLRIGIDVRTGTAVTAIEVRRGRLTGVRLAGASGEPDETLPTDLLVIACGITPRTLLASGAGLVVERGIVVDDGLATADPRVLAIGDCAEHQGRVHGLVAPAWEQARIAADLITGADPAARFLGHRPSVRLKAADLEVAVIGDALADPWSEEDGVEVVQLLDPGRDRYVKAVVRAGTVVGAAVVGDARAAAELRLMVERASPAPADLASLLLPGTRRTDQYPDRTDDPTAIPDRTTICGCHGVTKGALVKAWAAGARSAPDLSSATRACTGCGSCTDAVAGMARWLQRVLPEAAPTRSPTSPTSPTATRKLRTM
ncbi:MAG: NAD(P)/FAD-dependent oxidoreductase [Actinobacteria bacterium]|nr:NAD(P)/FAD-dependent oxidoreductase [Actinomycetota bacterium]